MRPIVLARLSRASRSGEGAVTSVLFLRSRFFSRQNAASPSATVASRRNRSPPRRRRRWGHVDVLVCSAGVAGLNAMTDYPIEEWKKVFDVRTGAVFDISCGRATYSAVGRLPSRSHGQVSVTLREARRRWTRCARKRCGAPDDGSRFGSSRRLPGLEGRRARCFGRWPDGERPGGRSGQARSRAELDRFTPPVEDGGSFFEIPCIFPWARQEIVQSSRAKPPREPTVGKAACSKNTHLDRIRG